MKIKTRAQTVSRYSGTGFYFCKFIVPLQPRVVGEKVHNMLKDQRTYPLNHALSVAVPC